MDPTLAEIYGTNQADEADIEKLAAAELAEQLSESGDVELDDETLEALATDVLEQSAGDEETEEPEMQAEGEEGEAVEEPSDEGQEKMAEADYLGRVMAHAYVHELKGIQKEAGFKEDFEQMAERGSQGKPAVPTKTEKAKDAVTGKLRGAANYVKGGITGKGATRAQKWGVRGGAGLLAAGGVAAGVHAMRKNKEKRSAVQEFVDMYGEEGLEELVKEAGPIGDKMSRKELKTIAKEQGVKGGFKRGASNAWHKTKGHAGKAWGAVKNNPKKSIAGGLALAGAGGAAAYAAKKHKEKKSSAVDTLAEQRALEVLAEAGYDVDAVIAAVQGTQVQEKTSEAEVSPYDVLANKVDERAAEMLNELVENGIIAAPEDDEETEVEEPTEE